MSHNLNEYLERFSSLPAEALVDVRVVAALYHRSIASIWRDTKAGHIPSPLHVGKRATRWRVGELRHALNTGTV